jgi:hypothetical protein
MGTERPERPWDRTQRGWHQSCSVSPVSMICLRVHQTMKNLTAKQRTGARPPLARLLFSDSGRGLHADADFLTELLASAGWRVERVVLPRWSAKRAVWSHRYASVVRKLPPWLGRVLDKFPVSMGRVGRSKADLQIHLETIAVPYLGTGDVNWLIPNQEWMRIQHLRFLPLVDRVLCKTEEAVEAFRSHHSDIRFIGFSNPIASNPVGSSDRLDRFRSFLHVAGRNRKKGSAAVVEAWRRHPEWPELQLVIDDPAIVGPLPSNVRVRSRVWTQQLEQLRRDHAIVLAPSEVEGFGHILLEGMATGGVVLTTDAAPMNELVSDQRGFLISWERSEPCHLGTRYFVDPSDIERAVDRVLQSPLAVLSRKAELAQRWARDNHDRFVRAFAAELDQLSMAPAADSEATMTANCADVDWVAGEH